MCVPELCFSLPVHARLRLTRGDESSPATGSCAATLPSAPGPWKWPHIMCLLKTCSGLQDPSCLFYLHSKLCVKSGAEGLQCSLFKARLKSIFLRAFFCSLLFHLQLLPSTSLSSTNTTELIHRSITVLLHGELLNLM